MKVVINKSDRLLRAPEALLGNMRLTEKLLGSRGLEYIDLDPVIPELPDSESFREKLKQINLCDNTPAEQCQVNRLKEAVADLYHGIYMRKLNPARDITITPGNRTTTLLLCLSIVNPGQAVAVPDPGLASYRIAAIMAGAEVKPYALLEKNDYLPNLTAIFEPPAKNLGLVFLNYPHNPTGAEAELYLYGDLINQLRYENILIVLDSPYCGPAKPSIELPNQIKKAVNLFLELHSFGFPYGLEGLGFAIGHRGAVANLEQMILADGFKPSKAEIAYALLALENHQELSQAYLDRLSKRRKILGDGLKAIGWQVRAGRLAPYIWAKIPAWATSTGFARKLFLRAGVRTRPGTDFGENGEGYLRFSLTASEDKITKALENIRKKQSMYRKRGG